MKHPLKEDIHEGSTIRDLLLLVKGLSSSEKSYFKKMTKRHADQNTALHIKLFKLIDESTVYDENRFCKCLGIINKVHFSKVKYSLHKEILDSLVFQKRDITVATRLYFMQEEVSLLEEKKLLTLALKLCKKAIALATRYEKYETVIILLTLQHKILTRKSNKQPPDNSPVFYARQQVNTHLHLLRENKLLYDQIRDITHHTWLGIETIKWKEIPGIKQVPDTIKPPVNKQPLISLYYLNTLALCQYMQHEYLQCTISTKKIFSLWNLSPHLINEYADLLLNSVNITCCNNFMDKNIQQVKKDIDSYRQLVTTYLKTELYLKYFEIIEFNTLLKIYNKTGQYGRVKKFIDQKASGIISLANKILLPPDTLSLSCSICISYFILEQWNDAENLLSVIKEKNRSVKKEDILYFSLLFYLIILYEKKEWYRLDNAVEAAYHFLYARKRLRPFERKMILFLKRLPAAHYNGGSRKLIIHILEWWDKMDNADKQTYFLYFSYYGWLESKLKGMRYMDYVSFQVKEDDKLNPVRDL